MTKVLFFTYAFPPINAPRSVQIARLLKHSSLKPSIVYGQGHYAEDQDLYCDYKNYVKKTIRIPFTKMDETIAKIRRKQPFDVLKHSDLFQSWSIKAADKVIRDFDYDVVVSFGSPMSVHLGALKIKQKTNVKWVACFSDPWSDNPFEKRSPAHQRKIERYEQQVIQNADCVFFNTQETIDLVMKKYDTALLDKTKILPHSYDPDLYPKKEAKKNEKITLRYIGHFYGNRSPEPLLKALQKLPSNLLKKIKIECYGSVQPHLIDQYSDLVGTTVFFNDPVSYNDSLKLMSSADGLLVIDAPADQSVFLPSKLVDYIGAQKPILGITPPGASHRILSDLNYPVANPNDTQSIEKMIIDFVKSENKTATKTNLFSPQSVAETLEQQITLLV